MKPEALRFLTRAQICIARAETMLSVDLSDDAARTAYFACFHAAQAYIFEASERSAKSHHGVQTEFFRLTKDISDFDAALRRFLSQAYEFKAIADYGAVEGVATSNRQAAEAIATAKRFVARVVSMIEDRDPVVPPSRK